MTDKLARSHCTVPGHGTDCVVATESRRRADKAAIREQVREISDAGHPE